VQLELEGKGTPTASAALFMTVGAKAQFIAAESATSFNNSASDFMMEAFFAFPSLSTQTFTHTVPSIPARRAMLG
jgi:hypothetical protein